MTGTAAATSSLDARRRHARLPAARCRPERRRGQPGAGRRPPGEDHADPRRRRGRIPDGAQPRRRRAIADVQLHRRLHPVPGRTALGRRSSGLRAERRARPAGSSPGAPVVLHWNPAHTFGLDAAQDVDAGADRATTRPGPPRERRQRARRRGPAAPAATPPAARAGRPAPAAGVPYLLLLAGVALAAGLLRRSRWSTWSSTSLQTGSLDDGYKLTWHFATYWRRAAPYWPQFLRSFVYAGHRDRARAC